MRQKLLLGVLLARKRTSGTVASFPLAEEVGLSPLASPTRKPLVFISHDTRDADLAEAFANLLTDASGGVLKSFRSSDRKGTAGIEFGAEWYKAIMDKLADATDVVALLSQHSIDRPWILYEAGVAKGKLGSTVFGVALGVPLEKASTGPFAQFQNCADDAESLSKLVIQLIKKNPEAAPREEAVKLQVDAFRQQLSTLAKVRSAAPHQAPHRVDETAVAKLFEEVKVLFRDLPEQVEEKLKSVRHHGTRRVGRRIHPGFLEELLFRFADDDLDGLATAWLLFMGAIREDLPIIYDLGMEMHRAIKQGIPHRLVAVHRQFIKSVELLTGGPLLEEIYGPETRDAYRLIRHIAPMTDHFLKRCLEASRRRRRELAAAETKAHEAIEAPKKK